MQATIFARIYGSTPSCCAAACVVQAQVLVVLPVSPSEPRPVLGCPCPHAKRALIEVPVTSRFSQNVPLLFSSFPFFSLLFLSFPFFLSFFFLSLSAFFLLHFFLRAIPRACRVSRASGVLSWGLCSSSPGPERWAGFALLLLCFALHTRPDGPRICSSCSLASLVRSARLNLQATRREIDWPSSSLFSFFSSSFLSLFAWGNQ